MDEISVWYHIDTDTIFITNYCNPYWPYAVSLTDQEQGYFKLYKVEDCIRLGEF